MLQPLWSRHKRQRARGGWRLRLARDDDDDATESSISIHFGELFLDWCDGQLSSKRLCRHAETFCIDGFQHDMANNMNNAGSDQHAHAGLKRLLTACEVTQQLTRFPGEYVSHIVLPSAWVKMLMRYPHEFRLRLGAEKNRLRAFWEEFLRRPLSAEIISRHPFLIGLTLEELQYIVPITTHTDAAPCSKSQSCTVISFSGLLAIGDDKLTKFPCDAFLKRGGSEEQACKHILDDLYRLALHGTDPWKFLFLFSKQDEEVRCNEFGCSSFSTADQLCSECLADRGARPYTDLQVDALWRPTEILDFLLFKNRLRHPLHPLARSALCSHRHVFYLDIMYLMDCKGAAAWSYGGLGMYLLRDHRLGNNRDERLHVINTRFDSFKENSPSKNHLPKLYLKNFVANDGWADLHGVVIKAAGTRHAAPFFKDLAYEFYPSDCEFDVNMRGILGSLNDIYNIIYGEGMFMSDPALAALRHAVVSFGRHYQWLRQESRRLELMAFPVKPKIHKLQHLPLYAALINPRFVQCYSEEALMGTISKTFKKSISGRYAGVVQETILLKRVMALLLRFEMGTER